MGKPRNSDRPTFVMVNKSLWESGLAAAMGKEAFYAFMALAKHLNSDNKSWPSQKRIAADMGVSEQTANKYIKRLLDFRLLDGQPLVRAVERPNGKAWQSRFEYHFHPACQVTYGHDPAPIDPALVPKPAPKSEASLRNVEKARKVASEKRTAARSSEVKNDLTPFTTVVEPGLPTDVEPPSSTSVACKYIQVGINTIRTLECQTASPSDPHVGEPEPFDLRKAKDFEDSELQLAVEAVDQSCDIGRPVPPPALSPDEGWEIDLDEEIPLVDDSGKFVIGTVSLRRGKHLYAEPVPIGGAEKRPGV